MSVKKSYSPICFRIFRRYLWKMWKRRTADTEGSSGFQAILHTEQWFYQFAFVIVVGNVQVFVRNAIFTGKYFQSVPVCRVRFFYFFVASLKSSGTLNSLMAAAAVASLSLFYILPFQNKGYCPDPKLWFAQLYLSLKFNPSNII